MALGIIPVHFRPFERTEPIFEKKEGKNDNYELKDFSDYSESGLPLLSEKPIFYSKNFIVITPYKKSYYATI
jgi:hypothetical protein